ncbi:phage holin family protein [Leptolyngbya sp. GB1-A1]|uniref:phage holin family protein n=1 Tax=Leptolyngbya sp. GB1-A1 TaxID=2933908 RepID=UPI003299FFD2
MLGAFFTTLATALSLLVVDLVVPGVDLDNFVAAMVAAVVIGFVNAVIRPIIATLSLPINFLTLGAFSLVVNGLCLWLAAAFVPGFSVHGLLGLILAPVILSFVNTFLSKYFAERNPNLDLKSQA